MEYDYLIIGGGLAGSTCAYLLGVAGKSVLLIEREQAQSKDKLCGGMMTPRAVSEFRSIYGESNLAQVSEFVHVSMRILFAAHDKTISIPDVVGTNRPNLDRFALSSALDAGIDFLDCATVQHFDFAHRIAYIDTPIPITIEYKNLIAADGVGSRTRKAITKLSGRTTRLPRAESFPSLEAYVSSVSDQLTGRFIPEINGYCWYAPCGSQANIGVCGSKVISTQQLRKHLLDFAHDLEVSLDPSIIRGACIPCGNTVALSCPEASAYFLGDAAGLANPVTGEGIYYALRSAHALAFCEENGLSYERFMLHELLQLKLIHASIPILFNERNTNEVLKLAHNFNLGSGKAARLALRLFADF